MDKGEGVFLVTKLNCFRNNSASSAALAVLHIHGEVCAGKIIDFGKKIHFW